MYQNIVIIDPQITSTNIMLIYRQAKVNCYFVTLQATTPIKPLQALILLLIGAMAD